jgi:hypothetical protein
LCNGFSKKGGTTGWIRIRKEIIQKDTNTIFPPLTGTNVKRAIHCGDQKILPEEKGLELSCSIYGQTITRDKIAVTAWILPVRSLQVIGWLFPKVKVELVHNKGKNKGK